MGRHSKLTPEAQARVVAAVRRGAGRETAARLAGVHRDTLRVWMKHEGEEYAGFQEAVLLAEAEWEMEKIEQIQEMAQGGKIVGRTTTTRKDGTQDEHVTYSKPEWTALMTMLERKMPDKWGRKDRVEITALIQREAEKIAEETGLDAGEIAREAEAILRRAE